MKHSMRDRKASSDPLTLHLTVSIGGDVRHRTTVTQILAYRIAVVALAGKHRTRIGWRVSPISCTGLSSKQATGRFRSCVSA